MREHRHETPNMHDVLLPRRTALTGLAALSGGSALIGASVASPGTALAVAGPGNPWYDVTEFGADPTGQQDSTAAIQAAIDAATGSEDPATTTRYCSGPVYLPAGTYKVTADLVIRSVTGFHLLGAGMNQAFLMTSGTGFQAAVLHIDGAAYSTFEGFSVRSDSPDNTTPTDPVPTAILLTWTPAAKRSTTANVFRRIFIRNLKYITGIWAAGTSTTSQVDSTSFEDVTVKGYWTSGENTYWQAAVKLGIHFWGNNYNHAFFHCVITHNRFVCDCDISGFVWYGGQTGFSGTEFVGTVGAQISIHGLQSQNSERLIDFAGAARNPASVRDVLFKSSSIPADGEWIRVAGRSVWEISNVYCRNRDPEGTGVIAFNGQGHPEIATLTNVSQPSPPNTGVTVTSGGTILAINYSEVAPGPSNPVVNHWGLWTVNVQEPTWAP